jgi:hypothetical protein
VFSEGLRAVTFGLFQFLVILTWDKTKQQMVSWPSDGQPKNLSPHHFHDHHGHQMISSHTICIRKYGHHTVHIVELINANGNHFVTELHQKMDQIVSYDSPHHLPQSNDGAAGKADDCRGGQAFGKLAC